MKVRCTKFFDALGNEADLPRGLRIGEIYTVLSVVCDSHGRWLFQVMPHYREGPALYLKEQFEVVDARPSTLWKLVWTHSGTFQLTPDDWASEGFWDRYFDDGELEARVFLRDVAIIEAE
jgi:hypothetical protein